MRKNTDEGLLDWVKTVKEKFAVEYEEAAFPMEEVLKVLEEERKSRLKHFLFKTTGHFGDADFLKFLEILEASGKKAKKA